MILYLLKFSACLAIFLAFYKYVLERESMHGLKRIYLLVALLSSLGIPLVTFTYYSESSPEIVSQIIQEFIVVTMPSQQVLKTDYLSIILWSVYGLGVFVFGVRFCYNLFNIFYKIKDNPKRKNNNFTNVLLVDLMAPYTFFNYIFFNKSKFETNQIPKEVFWHEQTHAKQKHSLDILFIELLQVIFWFNPIIYFTKHLIKLNHEFLADQSVLNKGVIISTYQQILLAFTSNKSPQFVNAINYSSIKKRFTVMKTQSSRKSVWFRSFFLLPLFAIVLYSFSDKVTVQKKKPNLEAQQSVKSQEKEKKSVLKYPKSPFSNSFKIKSKSPSKTEFNKWKNQKKYALWLDGKVINNDALNKYNPSDIVFYVGSFVHINARSKKYPQSYQFHLYTKKGFEDFKKSLAKDQNVSEEIINQATQNVEIYKKKYKVFVMLKSKKPHYIYKSKEEQKVLDDLFSDLGGMYFRMMRADKNKVAHPGSVAPIWPYVKFKKDGKFIYKKQKDLTPEDLKLLPFPPKKPSKDKFVGYIHINISKDNHVVLDDKTVTMETITSVVKKIVTNYNIKKIFEVRAIIKADEGVEMGFVNDVFSEAVKAGVSMKILK